MVNYRIYGVEQDNALKLATERAARKLKGRFVEESENPL